MGAQWMFIRVQRRVLGVAGPLCHCLVCSPNSFLLILELLWLATSPSSPGPVPNPSTKVTGTHDHTDFYVGSGDLNLGPHVVHQDSYLLSSLPTIL